MKINFVVTKKVLSLFYQNIHTMKFFNFCLIMFFVAVFFVLVSMLTKNVDLFIWAGGLGELFAFFALGFMYLNRKNNSIKIWW